MATLSEALRAELWGKFMRTMGPEVRSSGFTKTDLKAAVDALDNWLNLNQGTTVNNIFPTATRNGLTAEEKMKLLVAVADCRADEGVT
jgi:hypothetical protein